MHNGTWLFRYGRDDTAVENQNLCCWIIRGDYSVDALWILVGFFRDFKSDEWICFLYRIRCGDTAGISTALFCGKCHGDLSGMNVSIRMVIGDIITVGRNHGTIQSDFIIRDDRLSGIGKLGIRINCDLRIFEIC